jgi:hypothetical protein
LRLKQEAIREMIAPRGAGMALRPIAAAISEKGLKVSHETVKQVVAQSGCSR